MIRRLELRLVTEVDEVTGLYIFAFIIESRSALFRPMPFLASLLETILPFSNAIIVGTASIENLSHSGL